MDAETDSVVSIQSETSHYLPVLGDYCRTIPSTEPTHENGKVLYACKYCDYSKPNASNFRLHLANSHQLYPPKRSSDRTTPRDAAARDLIRLYEALKASNQTEDLQEIDSDLFRRAIKPEIVKQSLLDMIVVQCLPLSTVERPEFHRFCLSLNPAAAAVVPSSHNTIKSWMQQSFDAKKDVVRKTLQSAKTRIHLSVDVWTSPNTHLVFAVCGHFINVDEQLKQSFLAFVR